MIIDTADDVTTKLTQLKDMGCVAIIQYDDRHSTWKQITPTRARAIRDAGILLAIVYEHIAQPSGEEDGYADAEHSIKMAAARGQPKNSAIYFAVDYDASNSDINNKIVPYFRGVARSMLNSGLRVGVYGSGQVCKTLKALGLVSLTWITCSRGFTGSAAYIASGLQDLWQTDCDKFLLGLSVDYNSARNPDWGAFVPWGDPDTTPVPKPLHDMAWVQTSLNTLGQLPPLATDNIAGPKTKAAIKAFQVRYSLVPDGIAGPVTQAALEQALNEHHSPPVSTGGELAGKPMNYLIGVDSSDGIDSTITEIGYDAVQRPTHGIGVKYGNLFDQRDSYNPDTNTGDYGPYLDPTDTAGEYGEGVINSHGTGWSKNLADQIGRAKDQNFNYIEFDNPDAYEIGDVIRALDTVQRGGLLSIAKNSGLFSLTDGASYLGHPSVAGVVIEKDAGTPQAIDAQRKAAGKPSLPVWFVFFGAGGAASGQQVAHQILQGGYHNMGVTNSPDGEYTSSIAILNPTP